MSFAIAGTYVLDCSCSQICPCAIDGTPTGPEDHCWGGGVFHIDRGDQDGVDLSGVNFGLVNYFPENLTKGNWKIGVIVDQSASDEQVKAVEKIVSGQEGGPFAEFAPLISEFGGIQRGKVTFSDGDKPQAFIDGVGDITFDPAPGTDAGPTTLVNAMFGFAPEVKIGRSSGKLSILGKKVDVRHAEAADFEYSSEGAGGVHPRA